MDNGSGMAGTRKNSIRIGADDELKLHRECNIIAAQPSTNTLDHDIGTHVSGDSKTATSTSEIMGDIYAVHIGVRENSEMCLSGNVITMLPSTKAPDHDNGNHVSGNSKTELGTSAITGNFDVVPHQNALSDSREQLNDTCMDDKLSFNIAVGTEHKQNPPTTGKHQAASEPESSEGATMLENREDKIDTPGRALKLIGQFDSVEKSKREQRATAMSRVRSQLRANEMTKQESLKVSNGANATDISDSKSNCGGIEGLTPNDSYTDRGTATHEACATDSGLKDEIDSIDSIFKADQHKRPGTVSNGSSNSAKVEDVKHISDPGQGNGSQGGSTHTRACVFDDPLSRQSPETHETCTKDSGIESPPKSIESMSHRALSASAIGSKEDSRRADDYGGMDSLYHSEGESEKNHERGGMDSLYHDKDSASQVGVASPISKSSNNAFDLRNGAQAVELSSQILRYEDHLVEEEKSTYRKIEMFVVAALRVLNLSKTMQLVIESIEKFTEDGVTLIAGNILAMLVNAIDRSIGSLAFGSELESREHWVVRLRSTSFEKPNDHDGPTTIRNNPPLKELISQLRIIATGCSEASMAIKSVWNDGRWLQRTKEVCNSSIQSLPIARAMICILEWLEQSIRQRHPFVIKHMLTAVLTALDFKSIQSRGREQTLAALVAGRVNDIREQCSEQARTELTPLPTAPGTLLGAFVFIMKNVDEITPRIESHRALSAPVIGSKEDLRSADDYGGMDSLYHSKGEFEGDRDRGGMDSPYNEKDPATDILGATVGGQWWSNRLASGIAPNSETVDGVTRLSMMKPREHAARYSAGSYQGKSVEVFDRGGMDSPYRDEKLTTVAAGAIDHMPTRTYNFASASDSKEHGVTKSPLPARSRPNAARYSAVIATCSGTNGARSTKLMTPSLPQQDSVFMLQYKSDQAVGKRTMTDMTGTSSESTNSGDLRDARRPLPAMVVRTIRAEVTVDQLPNHGQVVITGAASEGSLDAMEASSCHKREEALHHDKQRMSGSNTENEMFHTQEMYESGSEDQEESGSPRSQRSGGQSEGTSRTPDMPETEVGDQEKSISKGLRDSIETLESGSEDQEASVPESRVSLEEEEGVSSDGRTSSHQSDDESSNELANAELRDDLFGIPTKPNPGKSWFVAAAQALNGVVKEVTDTFPGGIFGEKARRAVQNVIMYRDVRDSCAARRLVPSDGKIPSHDYEVDLMAVQIDISKRLIATREKARSLSGEMAHGMVHFCAMKDEFGDMASDVVVTLCDVIGKLDLRIYQGVIEANLVNQVGLVINSNDLQSDVGEGQAIGQFPEINYHLFPTRATLVPDGFKTLPVRELAENIMFTARGAGAYVALPRKFCVELSVGKRGFPAFKIAPTGGNNKRLVIVSSSEVGDDDSESGTEEFIADITSNITTITDPEMFYGTYPADSGTLDTAAGTVKTGTTGIVVYQFNFEGVAKMKSKWKQMRTMTRSKMSTSSNGSLATISGWASSIDSDSPEHLLRLARHINDSDLDEETATVLLHILGMMSKPGTWGEIANQFHNDVIVAMRAESALDTGFLNVCMRHILSVSGTASARNICSLFELPDGHTAAERCATFSYGALMMAEVANGRNGNGGECEPYLLAMGVNAAKEKKDERFETYTVNAIMLYHTGVARNGCPLDKTIGSAQDPSWIHLEFPEDFHDDPGSNEEGHDVTYRLMLNSATGRLGASRYDPMTSTFFTPEKSIDSRLIDFLEGMDVGEVARSRDIPRGWAPACVADEHGQFIVTMTSGMVIVMFRQVHYIAYSRPLATQLRECYIEAIPRAMSPGDIASCMRNQVTVYQLLSQPPRERRRLPSRSQSVNIGGSASMKGKEPGLV